MILDEPTGSLDTDGVQDVHRILNRHRSEGETILLSSQYMEDIAALYDEVFRMEKGVLSRESTPAEWAGGNNIKQQLS